ncbi:M16 family metallopeptidase [Roseimaritima sediminicola]|uniref:M16 family metallopeptidase n=1 Tax=Roseimaritima sediminicola TaxID=2662066 RepID=UPI0012983BAB|nr:pitrilysin family protein [Roseimaritima sediminicola]
MDRRKLGSSLFAVAPARIVAPVCLLALLLLASLVSASNLYAQEEPMKVTQIEGISEYRLENGLRVLLFPDPSKDLVTVNMTVFVGSRHEGYGEAGMAHLLEHMLFKGTPTHPQIPQVLQDRSAKFNGTTSVDRTNYYETLPASEDNLEFALRLEADRLVNSFIRGEDLASEMTVVRNEFERGENSPVGVLMQRMQSAAYEWHNYGKTTIGNRSDIERVPILKLRQFYRKYYRVDNAMVIIAGKFDPAAALDLVVEHFGPLEAPDTPIDQTYTTEPPQDGERTVVLRRVGEVPWIGAAYHIPAAAHEDFVAMKVLMYVLADEPSGRLYQELVESGLASNVYARATAYHDPGLFMALLQLPPDASLEKARGELIRIIEEGLTDQPITDREVERAKQQILKDRELEAADSDKIAVALSNWAAQGDWRLYFLYRDRVEAVTTDLVQAAANKYFTRNNRTVGLYIPSDETQRVTIPPPPSLQSLLAEYEGRGEIEVGESFDPTPENIEQRTERGSLVGGIQYALLPKKTRGGGVSIRVALRFGTEGTLQDRVAAAELLGLLMSRGTETLDYQALQDELTRLRADLTVNSTPGLLQLQVNTKNEFVPEVLDLLEQIIRSPRLAEEELEVIRRQVVTNLEASLNEPQALAPRRVRRHLAPYDQDNVRYVRTLEEELQMYRDVQVEEIRELYERFIGNQAGEVVMVGDFDGSAARERWTEILDDWTAKVPYERFGRPAHPDVPGQVDLIETPDKSNAMLFAQQQYALSDDEPEYPALVIGNFILGGGSLSSRLADRVRQSEGLSYTIRSMVTGRKRDDRTDFIVYAITNPQNKDKLLEVIREEIRKILDEGVTEDELQRAKQAYLGTQRVQRSDDANVASLLLRTMFNERTMAYHAELEEQVEALTVEQVNEAVRRYIDPDQLVIAVAGDFAASKQ